MSNKKTPEALRTIGEVAADIGVATHVLRFWEEKFPQIGPQKRRGRRYYDANAINVIKTIKELLYEQGYTVKGVTKFLSNSKHKPASNENIAIKEESAMDLFENNIVIKNEEFQHFNAQKIAKLTQIYHDLCVSRNKLKELR